MSSDRHTLRLADYPPRQRESGTELMFTLPLYGDVIYISQGNLEKWKEREKQSWFAEGLEVLITHEKIHIVLDGEGLNEASEALDNRPFPFVPMGVFLFHWRSPE